MMRVKIEAFFKLNYFYFFCFILFFDLGSKFLISNYYLEPMTLLPVLDLLLVKNSGIALSLFSDLGENGQIILSALIFIALVFIYLEIKNSENKNQKISLTLILGGGMGNFIERIFYGEVTDFFHLRLGDFSFFIFNFADFFITLGAFIFVYTLLVNTKST